MVEPHRSESRSAYALLPLAAIAALLWSGCAGPSGPVAPGLDQEGTLLPVAPASGAGDLTREGSPDPLRSGETTDLTGKWFGKLANFDPAEPAANSWNIDFELTQVGGDVQGVVIISEVIPIAANVWDVHLRLDASVNGHWDNGQAQLYLFEDAKIGGGGNLPVVDGGVGDDREMEFVEAILTGVVDDELQGSLVIHWRNPRDRHHSWTQTCELKSVIAVSSGTGGGPG